MDRFFRITARGSSVRTEVLAGLATFATMAYIVALNPAILGAVKDSAGHTLAQPQLVTVTALVAGLMTILMGLVANVPMALAAGLGINSFLAFTLVAGRGLAWPDAMGVVVIEGVVMLLLVVAGLREAVMDAIPDSIKRSISAGIGLFIALIGLVDGGIVEHPRSGTIVAITSDFKSWNTLVFVVALLAITILMARNVPGALLIGILAATVVGIVVNKIADGSPVVGAELPHSVTATPDFGLVGRFSLSGLFDHVGLASAIALILTVLMANFFDAMGTALAVGRRAGLTDEHGRLPQMRRVLLVESAGAIVGGGASASSNTIFVESTAGAAQGARTGLANVVTGIAFLLCMFLSPIAAIIPSAATGPALVVVGALMLSQVADIDWHDLGVAVPAFATIALMPFTYSIANGVGAGVVLYTLIAIGRGRWRDVHPLMAVVAAVFVWYFLRGAI